MSIPPSLEDKITKGNLKRITFFVLKIFFSLALTTILSSMKLDYFESFFYDLRIRTRLTTPTSGKIALTVLTPKDIEAFQSQVTPEILTTLLTTIEKQNPRFIILNLDTKKIEGTFENKLRFSKWAATLPNFFVTSDELVLKGAQKLALPAPFHDLPVVPAPKTLDAKIYARDNVTRRMFISYQGQALLHANVAAAFNPSVKDLDNIHNQFELANSQQLFIDYHPHGTYPRFSFSDIISAQPKDDVFKDKIVIVGNDTELSSDDYVQSPYSREIANMSTSEMQANMFDTVIMNSAPSLPKPWVSWVLTFLISIFTIHVVLSMKPSKGLLLLGQVFLAFVIVCYFGFWLKGWWIPMAKPILAVFLCYYFFIPYRLIVENRRSWEYYQKNKLLSQVEELKTNFISMMSHDLKTPIARIQGMTDVILSDAQHISTQQREAVDTIKHSADDLLKFISAILNYGRIESEGVQLHLQSKDINTLLQEVVRKHEFLAKVKRIQIVSELEPMFPIPMDADLMKQVLSNLVENAIKYSPEDTKIMVSSEEQNDKIVIQVADQGPGIPADELPNIFMKFFRSKNAKSSPIKGSGLGLYLAKYFTELHKGSLSVESNYGNGSTFTVELPMEQGVSHA